MTAARQCRRCREFFARFRCAAASHGECSCPKCSGLCTCSRPWEDRNDDRAARCRVVNQAIEIVSLYGRRFFRYPERVSRLEVDRRGRVWYFDGYSGKRIYTHRPGRWRGFDEGGTLKALVEAMRDYVMYAIPISAHHFGPFPAWMCDGDPWGYGDDMAIVRDRVRALGIVTPTTPAKVSA